MIKWVNVLHFYQPPTASDKMIDEVVKSSYQSWVDFLNKYKKVKVTVNFTACLTERLYRAGYDQLLKDITKIAQRGQIEFVESATFHPILPLLPEKEIIKQIEINAQINKLRFGKIYQPQGFFLPEMAYSDKVGKVIKKLGYKYIILDQIALNKDFKNIDNDLKYKLKNGLQVVFRDRKISQSFVPATLIDQADKLANQNIVTATDGELYGHHYWNWWPPYSHLINKKNVSTLTVTEYLKNLKKEVVVKPVASSWESKPNELKRKMPYAVWNDPKNKIHKLLWQLANFALKLNWDNEKDSNHFASRIHLEKGLASCTFWWASGRDFKMFSPHAWQTSMVEVGAHELLNSIRSLKKIDNKHKLKAEKMFSQIRDLVWQRHWKK